MNDLRKEREHVGRRWALAGNVFMAILVVTAISYAVSSAAMRTCGRHLFGFGNGYRWCGLAETWSWGAFGRRLKLLDLCERHRHRLCSTAAA